MDLIEFNTQKLAKAGFSNYNFFFFFFFLGFEIVLKDIQLFIIKRKKKLIIKAQQVKSLFGHWIQI
jgi:hypothetical protein